MGTHVVIGLLEEGRRADLHLAVGMRGREGGAGGEGSENGDTHTKLEVHRGFEWAEDESAGDEGEGRKGDGA